MNHIQYATKWHFPPTVDIYWSIDDDDLAIKVVYFGKDITPFLTAEQIQEVDTICRQEAYDPFPRNEKIIERNNHA